MRVAAWDSDGVKQAIDNTAKMFDYLNPDHAALTWNGAVDEVIEGKGAFTSMGVWAWGGADAKKGTQQVGGRPTRASRACSSTQ